MAYYNLGHDLEKQGKRDEAIDSVQSPSCAVHAAFWPQFLPDVV
jgi:hypothetical protein